MKTPETGYLDHVPVEVTYTPVVAVTPRRKLLGVGR